MKLNGMLLSWYSCPCYTCHLISVSNFSVSVRVRGRIVDLDHLDRRSGGLSGRGGPVFGLCIFLFGGLM